MHSSVDRTPARLRLAAFASTLCFVALLGSAWWFPGAAGAAPTSYGPSALQIGLTVGHGSQSSVNPTISGSADPTAGTFSGTIPQTYGTLTFPYTDSSGTRTATVSTNLTQVGVGQGTMDAGAGTATFVTTFTLSLGPWYSGSGLVTDFAPCNLTIDLSTAGSYVPATGVVSLHESSFTVAAPADPCGSTVNRDAVIAGLTSTPGHASLDFSLPLFGVPPIITTMYPGHGQPRSLVTLTGNGYVPGATEILFGSTVIAAADVAVANDHTLSFAVPFNALPGDTDVAVRNAAGTSAPARYAVEAPPALLADFPFSSSPMLATGVATSTAPVGGTFSTLLTFTPGTYIASLTGPGGIPYPAGGDYQLTQSGGGSGTVDPVAGRASLDVTLTLTLTGDGDGPYQGAYHYFFPLHLSGPYDPATGRVLLDDPAMTVAKTTDVCQKRFDDPTCSRVEFVRFADDVLFAGTHPATLAFTLPAGSTGPPSTTTTTTATTTTPPATTSTTTTSPFPTTPPPTVIGPGGGLPVPTVLVPSSSSTTSPSTPSSTTGPAGTEPGSTAEPPPGGVTPTTPAEVPGGVVPSLVSGSTGSRGSSGAGLARTGAPIAELAGIGVALLLSGALLAADARRRGRRS